MKTLLTLALLTLGLGATPSYGALPVDVADARFTFCITCHGANAQGNPGWRRHGWGGYPLGTSRISSAPFVRAGAG